MARANCGELLIVPALRPCAGSSSSMGRRPSACHGLRERQHLPACPPQRHASSTTGADSAPESCAAQVVDAGRSRLRRPSPRAAIPRRGPGRGRATWAAAACRTGGRRRARPARARAAATWSGRSAAHASCGWACSSSTARRGRRPGGSARHGVAFFQGVQYQTQSWLLQGRLRKVSPRPLAPTTSA